MRTTTAGLFLLAACAIPRAADAFLVVGKKGKAETDEVRSLRYMHNGLIESIL